MKIQLVLSMLLAFGMCAQALATDDPAVSEIQLLRQELLQMRQDYEARIDALERRVDTAEQRVGEQEEQLASMPVPAPAATAYQAAPTVTDRSKSSDFNPALGVIFEGQSWFYDNDPHAYFMPGFPLGGEAHPVAEGLSLGETEINISANVDDLFTAWLTVPVVIEDGETAVEIEEAWIETLSLPGGLSARFGRVFSNIGYLNQKHAHSWDFVDQPLAYQAFLGNQYIDDGVQVRWLAPTDIYFQLSAEILRGDRYPAAGAADSGFGATSLKALFGGDVGIDHSWQAGLSYLDANAMDRESGDEDDPLLFTGDTELLIAEAIWKWAPNGNWRQRNFKLQAEYMWRSEDGVYTLPGGTGLPWNVDQQGWYLQGIYQWRPQWRIGARIDALSGDDPGRMFDDSTLALAGDDPRRYSLMVDWSHSEFSRFRLQYTRDEAGLLDDKQFGIQYLQSIGAHGAHSF